MAAQHGLPVVKPVRQLRLERGWTTQQLADFAEVSRQSVQHFEAGRRVRPSTAVRIADALEVPIHIIAKVAEPWWLTAR